MNAMVLCPACKRHVFAAEPACPFCGIGFAQSAHPGAPPVAPELSRAQRYMVGAAIAASVATASCGSPTVVRNPDELGNVTVDVNETHADRRRKDSLEIANDQEQQLLAEQEARRLEAERLRREEEERQRKQLDEDNNVDWRERRWRKGGGCQNGVCPPYGCVFPDEAYDVVRV